MYNIFYSMCFSSFSLFKSVFFKLISMYDLRIESNFSLSCEYSASFIKKKKHALALTDYFGTLVKILHKSVELCLDSQLYSIALSLYIIQF